MLYVHGKKKREGMRRAVSFMMACMLLLGSLTIPEMKVKAAGDNLIANPNFAEEDMSAWMDVGATLTRESQDTAIFDDVTTFATISGRTQSYQGFSQDVTDKVVPGAEYEISFYVKLSEEYQELSASQRQVFFGPYVVENGQTSYLSQSYSPQIRGDLVKEVPVGQWVKLSGTYVVSEEATQVVVRFQEESSRGYFSYSITGVSMV